MYVCLSFLLRIKERNLLRLSWIRVPSRSAAFVAFEGLAGHNSSGVHAHRPHLAMKTLLAAILALHLLLYASICASADGDKGESEKESLIGLTVNSNYIIGTWPSHLKTVNNCENFRQNSTPPLFLIWPEDMFTFCCEDKLTNHTIASYVHSVENGRFLNPIKYFDVGIVNKFTPFWRSWLPDQISQKDITNLVWCEVNDLKRFYERRFWWEAFARQGVLFSGLPFVLLVEFLVLLAAVPQYVLWTPGIPLSKVLRAFWGWDSTWDVIHLCLLGINGSLLMEAVGHWDPCGWEAVLLYNSAVVYTYLSLLSIVSAVVQQIALWNAVTTTYHLRRMESKVIFENPNTGKVKRYKISTEWQLQRISAQCAVFYIASLYCTFVTVFQRDEFVAWLLGIIIIAQVWSCVVGFAMLFKAFKVGRSCYRQIRFARQTDLYRQDVERNVNYRVYLS